MEEGYPGTGGAPGDGAAGGADDPHEARPPPPGPGVPPAAADPPGVPLPPPAPPALELAAAAPPRARPPPRRVDHTYRDYSRFPRHALPRRNRASANFPSKLYRILATPEFAHVSGGFEGAVDARAAARLTIFPSPCRRLSRGW